MTYDCKGQRSIYECIKVPYFDVFHICIMYAWNEIEIIIFHDFSKNEELLLFLIMAPNDPILQNILHHIGHQVQ